MYSTQCMMYFNENPVSMLYEGLDLWHTDDKYLPREVVDLRDLYINTYSSAPSTTQMTERAVKHGNQCRGRNRDKIYQTKFAITRETIIREASLLETSFRDTRTCNSILRPIAVDDAMRTKTCAQCYFSYVNTGREGGFSLTDQIKFKRGLVSEEKNSYVHDRNQPTINAFRESIANSDLQQITLNDEFLTNYIPLIIGRIPYSNIKKDTHLCHVIEKLDTHGVSIPLPSRYKIRDLVKLLKVHERDDKSFKPVTSHENFDAAY